MLFFGLKYIYLCTEKNGIYLVYHFIIKFRL